MSEDVREIIGWAHQKATRSNPNMGGLRHQDYYVADIVMKDLANEGYEIVKKNDIKCPTCEGHGSISMEEAIDLRGDDMSFMVDQEYLDDLIFEAGGESIYPRCEKDGRRCVLSTHPVEEVRERNQRYRAAGLNDYWMCCRGEEEN